MRLKYLWLFTVLASLLSQAQAQSFAPDSVVDTVISLVATGGLAPGATARVGRKVLTPFGRYYDVAGNGEPAVGQAGSYRYEKLSATEGRIVFSNDATVLDQQLALTFSTEIGGDFADVTLAHSVDAVTGTFSIAPFSSQASLVNFSVRAFLSAGQNLNPGFVISGSVPRKVLIRAVGPTLANFGVAGAMANPKLTVFSDVVTIGINDDWEANLWADSNSTAAEIERAFTATGAFAFAPGSRDAAIVMTLAPGVYTALVQGSTKSEAGAVLLEIYLIK